jgi:hypothetical protein
MEIHLGLLPYPKGNDTCEEVSLYLLSFYHFVANKSWKKNILSSYIAQSNWIWKIYHIDIILRPKLCQFVQFEISPSMSHKVFIFLKITYILTGKSLNLLHLYLNFHHLLIFIFIVNTANNFRIFLWFTLCGTFHHLQIWSLLLEVSGEQLL